MKIEQAYYKKEHKIISVEEAETLFKKNPTYKTNDFECGRKNKANDAKCTVPITLCAINSEKVTTYFKQSKHNSIHTCDIKTKKIKTIKKNKYISLKPGEAVIDYNNIFSSQKNKTNNSKVSLKENINSKNQRNKSSEKKYNSKDRIRNSHIRTMHKAIMIMDQLLSKKELTNDENNTLKKLTVLFKPFKDINDNNYQENHIYYGEGKIKKNKKNSNYHIYINNQKIGKRFINIFITEEQKNTLFVNLKQENKFTIYTTLKPEITNKTFASIYAEKYKDINKYIETHFPYQ